MDRNSTLFICYSDISLNDVDLFADAYGIEYQYLNIINMLTASIIHPDEDCVLKLIEKITDS